MNRWLGILLFLPVPVVLILLTQSPIGIWPSLGLALLLIATHPLYARRFALRHAGDRSFWSGSDLGGGVQIELAEPLGSNGWAVANAEEAERAVGTLAWGYQRRLLLRACILGGLLLLIAGTVAAGLDRLAPFGLHLDDFRHGFRTLVALAVLPLSLLGARHRTAEPSGTPTPFPVHIAALIGLRWVLWLFRIIGVVWLAWGVSYAFDRLFN